MPQLTAQENKLLHMLTSPAATVMGKPRMKEVATMLHRLMSVADDAISENQAIKIQLSDTRHEASAIAVAAFAFVSRENIKHKKSLSEPLRQRCLQLRENYDYAKQYREEHDLEPMIDFNPEATKINEATQ